MQTAEGRKAPTHPLEYGLISSIIGELPRELRSWDPMEEPATRPSLHQILCIVSYFNISIELLLIEFNR